MSDLSRVEQLLRNVLGEDIYEVTPQSRVEALLVELNELIEGMDGSVSPEDIATAVAAYLDEHLTNPTNPPVDTSLSISGAAADAKKTGDELSDLKEGLKECKPYPGTANLLDISQESEKGVYYVNGVRYQDTGTTSNQSKMCSVRMDAEGGVTYYNAQYNRNTNTRVPNTNVKYLNFYDSTGAFISFYDGGLVNVGGVNMGMFTTPDDCAYIMMSYRAYENGSDTEKTYKAMVSKSPVPQIYVPYILVDLSYLYARSKTLDGDIATSALINGLKNKKVVCFGDSLFGLGGDADDSSKGIHRFLAEKADCTTYNIGFGGCNMARYLLTEHTWSAFCMHSLALAVSTNDYSAQDQAIEVSNASSEGSSEKLPAYFSTHLTTLKSIDFSNVDVVIIAYGTNDWSKSVRLSPSLSDTNEWDSYTGALIYSVKKILSAYPHIQIFVCTPAWKCFLNNGVYANNTDDNVTNNNGDTLPDFVKACVDTCENTIHVPCFNTYSLLGFNPFTWPRFLSDGTHLTKNGSKRYGDMLASFMISHSD